MPYTRSGNEGTDRVTPPQPAGARVKTMMTDRNSQPHTIGCVCVCVGVGGKPELAVRQRLGHGRLQEGIIEGESARTGQLARRIRRNHCWEELSLKWSYGAATPQL
uniref:Uncharacterized protein n=1 Tax=Oryza glaberrima TaxID=4538 RepID=I1QHW9_ORYGL